MSSEVGGASGKPKISIRGLGHGYGDLDVLAPLDLDVLEGQFLCIVGPSGCGKSTLLKALAGLVEPTVGEVVVQRRRSGGQLAAMVFQDYSIFPWKTVTQNVRFGLDVARTPRKISDGIVADLLGRFGLTDFAGARPAELSGGMRQRVAIARAFAVDPEILLMDEPFAALDAQLRMTMQEELLTIWESDRRTVLFVTHSIDEALLLGDRVIVMSARPGHVLATHEIQFERPRTQSLRSDPAFWAIHDEIWGTLESQVDHADVGSKGSPIAGDLPRAVVTK